MQLKGVEIVAHFIQIDLPLPWSSPSKGVCTEKAGYQRDKVFTEDAGNQFRPSRWAIRTRTRQYLSSVYKMSSSSSDDDFMLLDSVHTKVKRKRRAVHEINYKRKEFGEYHHLFSDLKRDKARFFLKHKDDTRDIQLHSQESWTSSCEDMVQLAWATHSTWRKTCHYYQVSEIFMLKSISYYFINKMIIIEQITFIWILQYGTDKHHTEQSKDTDFINPNNKTIT